MPIPQIFLHLSGGGKGFTLNMVKSGLVRFPNPLAIAKSETESLTRVGQVL